MDSLVTTDWLESQLKASDLRVVDATKFLSDSDRDARAEHEAGHIPGALFMDLAELTDPDSDIPNQAPNAEKFASRMRALGLGDGSRIVLYDDSPLHSATRAWWLLTMFGAQNVAILDGGLAKWKAEGRPFETGKKEYRERHYTAWREDGLVRDKAQMLANVASGAEEVVDARPADRFAGTQAEFREGLAAGHIPNSKNLPQGQLFNEDGTWKQGDDLRAAFDTAGVDLDKPLVTTCGSGMTAAVVAFGAYLLGKRDIALYDGSWAEWGTDQDTPKAQG